MLAHPRGKHIGRLRHEEFRVVQYVYLSPGITTGTCVPAFLEHLGCSLMPNHILPPLWIDSMHAKPGSPT